MTSEPTPPGGRPPKSLEEIRARLESVHRLPARQAGPLAGGLTDDDPIVVVTFTSRAQARRFQQFLSDAGVMSQLSRSRGQEQVLVDMSDRQRAAQSGRAAASSSRRPPRPPAAAAWTLPCSAARWAPR